MTTIILPVSRSKYLRRVFDKLESLICNKEETNILTYVDGDIQLYEIAQNMTVNSKFAQRLCVYRKKGQPNVGSVKRRRQRIADIHNELKQYLNKADSVLLIEDDTLIPIDALEKMRRKLEGSKSMGLISGIELGRWGYLHIGAWRANNIYDPTRIESIELAEGTTEIDASGMYCCLMKFDTYMSHTFKPFDTILGPDVDLGITLRQNGYLNYVDCSIKCTHMTEKEDITVSGSAIVKVALVKTDSGVWTQGLA